MSEENYGYLIQKLRQKEKIISIYKDLIDFISNHYPEDCALISEIDMTKDQIAILRKYDND